MIQKNCHARGGAVVLGVDACPALRLMGTAFHEAGHAVIACVVWPETVITSASIVADDASQGRVIFEEPLGGDIGGRVAARAAEEDALFSLGGYVAEQLFFGDEELPESVLGTPDFDDLVTATAVTWDGDSTRAHHALAYQHDVRDLLEDPLVWRAVSLVATTLLRERTLSGAQIRAIVDAVGVQPDPERELLFTPRDEDEEGEAFSWERW